MAKYLIILLTLTISSCATVPTCTVIDIPNRPNLLSTPEHVWVLVPLEAQDIWTNNDLSLKNYIKRIEGRIRLHNEVCK